MNLGRHIDQTVNDHFKKYKEILLLGSRQNGKTTLIQKIFQDSDSLLVDNEPIRKILESYDINVYKGLIRDNSKTIIIDKIHLLTDPGRAAKILFDQIPGIKLVVTGFSSLNIKNKTSESLAGRKIDYFLYPLTFTEYLFQTNVIDNLNYNILENIFNSNNIDEKYYHFDIHSLLNNALLYGLYPNMINYPQNIKYLINLVESLIYKDIVDLNLIENRRLAGNLLKILAHQIGNLINYSELSDKLNADIRTVKKYIEIFEQSFILVISIL